MLSFFFFKQKTAYEMRISDWSSDVCSSDLILQSAAATLVPVTTELGGKSPNIIFEDADIGAAVTGAVAGVFGASGQTCIAGSRLLVQRSVYDDVCQKIVEKVRNIRLGDPLDLATEMGPVAHRTPPEQNTAQTG